MRISLRLEDETDPIEVMSRREWYAIFLPLIFTFAFDQLSKSSARTLVEPWELGPLVFILTFNKGMMLGSFSELPAILRVVSLSTFGLFLFCIYVLIQYLLPIKSLLLRGGLSFLIGGILGNVFDRMRWGFVVDFVSLRLAQWQSPIFNVADALQWVGYFMIVFAVLRDGELLWPSHNARKGGWIHFKFQIRYSLILFAVGFLICLVLGAFCYTYLNVILQELFGPESPYSRRYLTPFLILFAFITLALSLALFLVGKIISHRVAGPVYAFENFIYRLIQTPPEERHALHFRLRAKDEFKNLEQAAQKIKDKL